MDSLHGLLQAVCICAGVVMRINRPSFGNFCSPFPPRLRLPIKKFSSSEEGVTAVEFGLIALPFFAILMAIIEAGLFFFASQVMDTGFRDAARQIRTGQAANATLEDFRTTMCAFMNQSTGLFNCENLYIDKRVLTDFSGANTALPLNNGNIDAGQMQWQYACGGKVVQVRAFYEWPSYANILGSSIANGPYGLANGNILLASTAVFKTEPYGGCS
jgi:Flp pilus assembly protein TadG